MIVREDMLNSHRTCHGGMIFALADTTFAYACNTHNRANVAMSCSISYLKPGREGERLSAVAVERVRDGRNGVYDVTITGDDDRVIAIFQGNSRGNTWRIRPRFDQAHCRGERLRISSFGSTEYSGGKIMITTQSPQQSTDRIETASRDEIADLQLKRLRWSLGHAYQNVPHYRRSFDAAGAHPDDLNELTDLAKFPFTVKDDLRQNYPFGMFAVPQDQVSRIHASSGTTGQPTVVGYTKNDIAMWAEVMARTMRAGGCVPGDVVHVAYGYGLFTGGLGAHYGAERLGCTVVPMSGGQTEKQVQLIRDFGATVIMVTPSYMLAIADEFERQGIDPRSTKLRVGQHGAEPWTQSMRAEIEARFRYRCAGYLRVVGNYRPRRLGGMY